jgi:hypothetical protein
MINKNCQKRINRYYYKKTKLLNKDFFKNQKVCLRLFVEHLKYIKTSMLLSRDNDKHVTSAISAITAAIAEFEAYEECTDRTKQIFHWNNFCELVKLNMGEWLTFNDSV